MIEQKRAIEALRSGVPNRDAVRAMGTMQPEIEAVFQENLAAVEQGNRPGGFLVKGGFGSGKSHLLEYLQLRAEEAGFVSSKIVIGKQTPLHDIGKVFRAALENARVPDRVGEPLNAITTRLDYHSAPYGEFRNWVENPRSGLNERFAASLYLFETLDDLEFSQVVLRFWSGETIKVGDLRKKLREAGEHSTYSFSPVLTRDLALQRFRFVARLIQAAGYKGWVLLFDEVEIVAQYSLLQRGRSYAEIARWARDLGAEAIDGVTSVLAMTNEFASEVLVYKGDADDVPNRLRLTGKPADLYAAQVAEIGMDLIRDPVELRPHDELSIDKAYQKLQRIYAEAYGWEPTDVRGLTYMASREMREYVRSWITAWDLKRLYPDYTPQIEAEVVHANLKEDDALAGEESPEWEN